jgi:adenylate cyclase class IV
MTSPHDELEVKARVDDPAALERAILAAGATLEFRGAMTDHRLDRDDMFAARGEMVRLRVYVPDGGSAYGVLGWKGPSTTRGAYRHRPELELTVQDSVTALELLVRIGLVETVRIDRRVAVYRLGGATLRLEWYPEMDVLIEIEGDPGSIEHAAAVTGLAREQFLAASLPSFVDAYERRTGRRARIAGAVT